MLSSYSIENLSRLVLALRTHAHRFFLAVNSFYCFVLFVFLENTNVGYDFESKHDLTHISKGLNSVSIDQKVFKHGRRSLKWTYDVQSTLSIDLSPQEEKVNNRSKKHRKSCGVYFWLYQPPVCYENTRMLNVTVFSSYATSFFFRIYLNFKYWRAIARRVPASLLIGRNFDTIMKIQLSIIKEKNGKHLNEKQCGNSLNIDLVRTSKRCSHWSYDMVNPPQTFLSNGSINEVPGSTEDLNGKFSKKNFWQQIYKWRKVDLYHISKLNQTSKLTVEEKRQLDELAVIEQRMDDWIYPAEVQVNELDRLSKFRWRSMYDCKFRGSHYKQLKKWYHDNTFKNFPYLRYKRLKSRHTGNLLLGCVQTGHKTYQKIFLSPRKSTAAGGNSHNVTTPLFATRDVFPLMNSAATHVPDEDGVKFSAITYQTLLPLAFEFHYSKQSRCNEIRKRSFKQEIYKHHGNKEHNKRKARCRLYKNISDIVNTSRSVQSFTGSSCHWKSLSGNCATSSNDTEKNLKLIKKELKYDCEQQKIVLQAVSSTSDNSNLSNVYRTIDTHRLDRLASIFEYLQQQGWADGSAVASADHLLNLNTGFTQSLYILRKYLQQGYSHTDSSRNILYESLLNTSRWYLEIGEIHQRAFKELGSTADKVRNAMPSRLLLVLATPTNDIKSTRLKLSDANRFNLWVENCLEINQGYGGLIKPDYVGYHHKGVYISHYITQAYHALALTAYLLRDTSFAIGRKHLLNLKNALITLDIMSNCLEIPYGVTGAKVSYSNAGISEVIPAFAYLAFALKTSPNTARRNNSEDNSKIPTTAAEPDKELTDIFLRLYDTKNPYLKFHLSKGAFDNYGKFYFNTIGSSVLTERLHKKLMSQKRLRSKTVTATTTTNTASTKLKKDATKSTETTEKTTPTTLRTQETLSPTESTKSYPVGHWCKNYAALCVHRRNNWTVVVKGFSKYVWDFEAYVDQNLYGLYQSHGHLQITNNRKSLDSFNTFYGWDWNRFPGTTTVELDLEILASSTRSRYFTNSTMVGGVVLTNDDCINTRPYGDRDSSCGKGTKVNGMFAMEFYQPHYENDIVQKKIVEKFQFKKSYFFYNDMIICLGSGITKHGKNFNVNVSSVVTTLFQTVIAQGDEIYVNKHKLNNQKHIDSNILLNRPMTFVDVNGNGYFVPSPKSKERQSLRFVNLRIGKNKQGMQPNGEKVNRSYIYTSLAFNHGTNPIDDSYEYAILVNGMQHGIKAFKKRFRGSNHKPYVVLRRDSIAHIVRVTDSKQNVTGYTIFNHTAFQCKQRHHVIRSVSRPVVVMVKETQTEIRLAIMDPDLRLFENWVPHSNHLGEKELYQSNSRQAETTVVLNFKHLDVVEIKNKNERLKESVVFQKSNKKHSKLRMTMQHGFTTEIKFQKNK